MHSHQLSLTSTLFVSCLALKLYCSILATQIIFVIQILLYCISRNPLFISHTHTLFIALTSTIPHPELKDLVLLPVIHWFELGLWLNIPEDNLNIIEADNPNNTEACRRKVYSSWLKSDPEASYRQLVDALHTVGYTRIADELCTKYGNCTHLTYKRYLRKQYIIYQYR